MTPAQVTDGVSEAIERARSILDELVAAKEQRTFENTLRPLDRITDVGGRAFADYAFMGYVHPDKEVRAAAKTAEEALSKFRIEVMFRDDLYEAVSEYAGSDEASSLEGEQARLLEFVQRDLRRAGHDLDPENVIGGQGKDRAPRRTRSAVSTEHRRVGRLDPGLS